MLWLILRALICPPVSEVNAVTTTVQADDDVTRADIILALGYLNDTAKDIRRKGYTGTASAAYTRQHARIDDMLTTLESMDG
jgi:hypothetical protein